MPQPTVQNELFARLSNCAKTPAQWANTAGTPMLGEPCWEIQEAQTASGLPYSFRLKIGDGTTSYANLPYYGDFVTLHTDNNTALSVAAWDGTNSHLNFYKVTETNGIVALEQNPYLRLKAGSKVTISTSTVGGVNVLQINHAAQEQGDVTEDTATLTDGGSFKVATGKDEYGHINKWTTFTLPSIATAISTAIGNLDSSVAVTGNTYVLQGVTEENGVLTAKVETQIVAGSEGKLSVTGSTGSITISHNNIDATATDASSGITTDNSSTVGEKNMDIVTGFKVDAQGHVIHIDKDSSMNLIAADIKAPVRMTDDSTWNYRETGGNISIGEDTARIPSLKGNTIVWNQLVNSSVFDGMVVRNSDGSYTINGTLSSSWISAVLGKEKNIQGHKYLLINKYVSGSVSGGNPGWNDGYSGPLTRIRTSSTFSIATHGEPSSQSTLGIIDGNGTTFTNYCCFVQQFDLTKLFGSDFNIEKALLGLTTEVAWDNLTADQLALAATNFEKLFSNSYYPYCEGRLVNLGGYGVKWNQKQSGYNNIAGTASISYTTDVLTATSIASDENRVYINNCFKVGHKYYVSFDYKSNMDFEIQSPASSSTLSSVNSYTKVALVEDCINGGHVNFFWYNYSSLSAGDWVLNIKNNIQIIDLTEMFGPGSEPTLEEFEAMFSDDYYEYNAGTEMNIFDAIGDKKLGLESTGFNKWDEEWNIGSLNGNTGAETPASGTLRTSFISVIPNKQYYTKYSTSANAYVFYYDENKQFVSYETITSHLFVPLTGIYFIRIIYDGYFVNNSTYNHDICINISCDHNGTYEPYRKPDTLDLDWIRKIEYTPDGSSTPEKLFPYGLLSAGSVYDEVQEGKLIKRVGVVDLGNNDYAIYTGSNGNVYGTTTITNRASTRNVSSILPKYTRQEVYAATAGLNGIGVTDGDSIINVSLSSQPSTTEALQEKLKGIYLYYELATPVEIPLDQPHDMTYVVDDHGTEQQLPINVSSVINAPFRGTFEYYSNFKEAVLDLINRVNDYTNPVRGKNNTAQTEGKLAEYDSDHTVHSSAYAPSNATIVAGQDGNEYILPSVAALVAYVQTLISSALHYRGTVASWAALPSSGQQTGDLYIFSAVDTTHTPPIGIGDFAVWNGSSWDLIQGTVTVTNNAPTLVLNGQTYTIGTVEGVSLTLVTPNLQMSDPTANGNANDLQVITNVSQTNGQLAATKKVIPGASVSQKGVVQLERDIHYSESPDKVPSAGQTWRELSKRNVKAVPISIVPVPAVYNTDLFASYELEASSNPQFTVNNSTFAQVYAANMGGYLFYVNNGVVYAAKMKATNWTKFDDDTEITSAIRAATETMIHVPTCNYKASGKKMKFGGLNPLYGGDYFKSPRWVGAYQINLEDLGGGDYKAHSRPGVGSAHSHTMEEFWNYAQNLHTDFGLANYEFHNLINALYQAMYGNLNSEYVLSDGNSRSSGGWDSYRDLAHGAADALGDGAFVAVPHCVAATDGAGYTRYVTKFCGFEDLFGKLWEFRSGIHFYMDGSTRKAGIYYGNQVSFSASDRVISGIMDYADGNYVTKMYLGDHWDMIPTECGSGGASNAYYCDGNWARSWGQLLLVGGYADNGSACGIACCVSYNDASLSSVDVGGRLAFYSDPIILSGADFVAQMA